MQSGPPRCCGAARPHEENRMLRFSSRAGQMPMPPRACVGPAEPAVSREHPEARSRAPSLASPFLRLVQPPGTSGLLKHRPPPSFRFHRLPASCLPCGNRCRLSCSRCSSHRNNFKFGINIALITTIQASALYAEHLPQSTAWPALLCFLDRVGTAGPHPQPQPWR